MSAGSISPLLQPAKALRRSGHGKELPYENQCKAYVAEPGAGPGHEKQRDAVVWYISRATSIRKQLSAAAHATGDTGILHLDPHGHGWAAR